MIALTAFEDPHITLLEKWLYAPHVQKWYHEPQDWLNEVKERNGKYSWLHHFIVEREGTPVGFCQYYAYQDGGETWYGEADTQGVYSIDYLIGEAAYLRTGLGKETVKALIEKVRLCPGARWIIAQPEMDNTASRALLRSCGFAQEEDGIYTYRL